MMAETRKPLVIQLAAAVVALAAQVQSEPARYLLAALAALVLPQILRVSTQPMGLVATVAVIAAGRLAQTS
jgi:hypothetical protein